MKLAVTFVTLLGSILAVLSCVFLLAGNPPLAFALVVLAMLLDMLDGPLARGTGVESRLGSWLDSSADIFIYLLFPALYWLIVYQIALPVLAVFIFAGCLRLLRFTLSGFKNDAGKAFYRGMPVYYDQLLLALTVAIPLDRVLLNVLLIAVSALAVSTIPFYKLPVRALSMGLVLYVAVVAFKVLYAG